MSEPAGEGRRAWTIDIAPLRQSPAYARMWFSGVASGIGSNATVVAVGIHVYDLSGSTFAVSLVGGFALVPMIVVGLLGGTVVDAFDRRRVLIIVSVIAWLSAVGLAVLAWSGVEELAGYYAFTTLSAASSTLVGTARFAIHPRLVDRPLLPAAAALSGISAGLQATIGPALAGILIASAGYAWTYTVDCLLYIIGFLGIVSLPAIPPGDGAPRARLTAVADGMRFLRGARNIRTAFILHVFALSFGRPHVLFPALAALLLGGGALTVGLLTAAGAVGVLATSALSGRLGTVRLQGAAMAKATMAGGAAVIGVGVVIALAGPTAAEEVDTVNVPAIVAMGTLLCAWGGAENIAGIFRTTMLQSAVPDAVRGRMQGLFTVILTAGPRVGDVFMGAIAALGMLWFPPLLGGLLIIVLVALLLRLSPTFAVYDALEPTP